MWTLCFWFLSATIFVIPISSSRRFRLHVEHESSCNPWNGKKKPYLYMRNGTTRIFENAVKPGCYRIRGQVVVERKLEKSLMVFAEIKHAADANKRAVCRNYTSNHCGGLGSCLHCLDCEEAKRQRDEFGIRIRPSRNLNMTKEEFEDCSVKFPKGNYSGYVSFCLPTLNEWNEEYGVEPLEEGAEPVLIPVYIEIYIYKFHGFLRQSLKLQRQHQEGPFREKEDLPPDESIDLKILNNYGYFDKQKRLYAIGCHYIVGNLEY